MSVASECRQTWISSRTNADVHRMIARYLEKEFSIPSQIGRIAAVHETRIAKRRGKMDDVDASELSWPEIRDAAVGGQIREAVTAKPEKQTVMGDHRIYPLEHVVPLADSTAVIRSRGHRSSGIGSNNVRDWRATVASKLARLEKGQAAALLWAQLLRNELQEIANLLPPAESASRRAGRRKRGARISLASEKLATLREAQTQNDKQLKSLVHRREYRYAVRKLLAVCTETEEIEVECFGPERAGASKR